MLFVLKHCWNTIKLWLKSRSAQRKDSLDFQSIVRFRLNIFDFFVQVLRPRSQSSIRNMRKPFSPSSKNQPHHQHDDEIWKKKNINFPKNIKRIEKNMHLSSWQKKRNNKRNNEQCGTMRLERERETDREMPSCTADESAFLLRACNKWYSKKKKMKNRKRKKLDAMRCEMVKHWFCSKNRNVLNNCCSSHLICLSMANRAPWFQRSFVWFVSIVHSLSLSLKNETIAANGWDPFSLQNNGQQDDLYYHYYYYYYSFYSFRLFRFMKKKHYKLQFKWFFPENVEATGAWERGAQMAGYGMRRVIVLFSIWFFKLERDAAADSKENIIFCVYTTKKI